MYGLNFSTVDMNPKQQIFLLWQDRIEATYSDLVCRFVSCKKSE